MNPADNLPIWFLFPMVLIFWAAYGVIRLRERKLARDREAQR